jgi:hypothetical protein
MFQQHEEFEQVEDPEILWRYQDLPRYIDLLLKNQLFFSRADRFEDPFEGKYNKPSTEKSLKSNLKKIPEESKTKENVDEIKQQINEIKEKHKKKRTEVAVSSWHINKDENYAMWKIYAKGSYGIALQTTYERLKRCFNVSDKPVYIGKVIYYDESYDLIPFQEDSFIPFLRKRLVYQYENEVRCCYLLSPDSNEQFSWQQQDVYNGVFIPVDLDTMIERIYISPYSPNWIRDIVEGINEKFNFNKEIVHSKVFDSADYW